jgi:hypothetical protein
LSAIYVIDTQPGAEVKGGLWFSGHSAGDWSTVQLLKANRTSEPSIDHRPYGSSMARIRQTSDQGFFEKMLG